jgi:hypothetical protein
MAVLKRRDLTRRIPAEVLARVERGGVSRDDVDWYAGRQARSTAESHLGSTPPPMRSHLERARGELSVNRRSSRTAARRDSVRRLIGAFASSLRTLLAHR